MSYIFRVRQHFLNIQIDDELKSNIRQNIEKLKLEGITQFAVRSSAITEDGEEASSAGQYDSFLGLQTIEEVFDKIVECWASLYSLQSVLYRKQRIQPILTSMAVLVQEMIDAETSGVVFSRHFLTGDPRIILISANYGLGEAVVSAKVEPDTFVIHKSSESKLDIIARKAGDKRYKIGIDSSRALKKTIVEDDTRCQFCLSDSLVLQLAELARVLENFSGSPRDIEFAITNDRSIYILQSRTITSLNNFTDFEIIHENDSAVMSPEDVLTTANIGEAFLGTVSPLSQSITAKFILDNGLGRLVGHQNGLHTNFFHVSQHRLFIDVYTVISLIIRSLHQSIIISLPSDVSSKHWRSIENSRCRLSTDALRQRYLQSVSQFACHCQT